MLCLLYYSETGRHHWPGIQSWRKQWRADQNHAPHKRKAHPVRT